MTEKDLGLKAAVRRLFWRMGFSTRVDVPLRAYVSPTQSKTKKAVQEYTDLDVLGIGLGPDFRVETVIADCKTSTKRSTERMFWVRGVADFFEADNAYLVRADAVSLAARQLASRLNVSVVTPADLKLLEEYHQDSFVVVEDESMSFLFDPVSIGQFIDSRATVDKRLRELVDYQQFDFWVYDEHRNLQQLIAHVADAAKTLDPSNPVHLSLFFDSAWLYTLALARSIQHIRRGHLTDIDTALQEYLFGGQLGLREKQQLAAVLKQATGRNVNGDEGVLPPYYGPLLEVVTRLMRRPQSIRASLRYAEWLTEAAVAGRAAPLREVFGDRYEVLSGKLLSDVCSFLVDASSLPKEFTTISRDLLAPNLNGTSDVRNQGTLLPRP